MTTMSQKPQSDDTSGEVCRAVTDAELDALVKRLENVSLQIGVPSRTILDSDVIRSAAAAITTLRAQLADANARADRAEFNAAQLAVMVGEDAVEQIEATVAAQIEEACAVIDAHAEHDQSFCCDGRECGCQGASVHDMMKHFIRQPHDRTALDAAIRAAKMEAWKEAADLPKRTEKLGGQNYAYVRVEEILALIEREGVE